MIQHKLGVARWLKTLGVMVVACSTTQCQHSAKRQDGTARGDGSGNGALAVDVPLDIGLGGEADRGSFVHSRSNNPFTSRTWNPKKMRQVAAGLERTLRQRPDDVALHLSRISAERLAQTPVARIAEMVQQLGKELKKKSISAQIPEQVLLELSVAAVEQKKWGMAGVLLDQLISSKNDRIRAGAFNVLGVQAHDENRISEAAAFWKQALAAVPNYEASVLNLGLLSVKYARFEDARSYLEVVSSDPTAQGGLLVASRLMGDLEVTSELCRVLTQSSAQGRNMPVFFNCGVHEWQSNGDQVQAAKLIRRAVDMKVGPADWSNHAFQVLQQLSPGK